MNNGEHNQELLKMHVATVVPFMIEDILYKEGGISEQHLAEARGYTDLIGSEGDAILYRSKKKGKSAQLVHALCRCLAIGSFAPGGIKFMGMHFEAESIASALDLLFARIKLADFEALRAAMEAEEKRAEEEAPDEQ